MTLNPDPRSSRYLISSHEFEFRNDDVLAPHPVHVLQRQLQRRRVLQQMNLKKIQTGFWTDHADLLIQLMAIKVGAFILKTLPK